MTIAGTTPNNSTASADTTAAMATGAGVGLAIGCVSIFPNFIAGCILGTGIGAGIGAYNGITGANPNVQPAFYEWLNATP